MFIFVSSDSGKGQSVPLELGSFLQGEGLLLRASSPHVSCPARSVNFSNI